MLSDFPFPLSTPPIGDEKRKNLAPLRRPQERLCRSTDRQARQQANKARTGTSTHSLGRWCKLKNLLFFDSDVCRPVFFFCHED
jgi:hypothetical protein